MAIVHKKAMLHHHPFFAIIHYDKCKNEKIKRCPENRIAQIREKQIKYRIGPFTVQLNEKPFIPFFKLLPNRNGKKACHSANVSEGKS
jgi:hypothetical protein